MLPCLWYSRQNLFFWFQKRKEKKFFVTKNILAIVYSPGILIRGNFPCFFPCYEHVCFWYSRHNCFSAFRKEKKILVGRMFRLLYSPGILIPRKLKYMLRLPLRFRNKCSTKIIACLDYIYYIYITNAPGKPLYV